MTKQEKDRQNSQLEILQEELNLMAKKLQLLSLAINDFKMETTAEELLTEDEMYQLAVQVVTKKKQASASMLQRSLKVGYARAARLMDLLEENSVIGPSLGAAPRKILTK